MKELIKSEGVVVTVCEPYTPQHNGTFERLNLELEEKMRVNLLYSGLPTYLWPFTVQQFSMCIIVHQTPLMIFAHHTNF